MSSRRTPHSSHARPKARARKVAITLGAVAVTAGLSVGAASAGVLPPGLLPIGTPDHVKEKAEAAAKAAEEARKSLPTLLPRATSVPKPSKPAGTKPTKKPRPTKTSTPKPKPSATKAPEASKPKPTPTPTSGSADKSAEAQVIALVNKERAAAGCSPVTENTNLTKAADDYSDVMAASGTMSHTGPDGSTMVTRAEAAGYTGWSTLGENIAMGQPDAAAVMKAWMNSPGHKANILNCSFKEIGVGVHVGDGGPWWTQDFGARR